MTGDLLLLVSVCLAVIAVALIGDQTKRLILAGLIVATLSGLVLLPAFAPLVL